MLGMQENCSCMRICGTGGIVDSAAESDGTRKSKSTILLKTNSNDFVGFWNELGDSNSNFVVAKIIFF